MARVIDPRYAGLPALFVFIAMLVVPALVCLASLIASQGGKLAHWVWVLPLVVGLGVLRRRVLARAERNPLPLPSGG